MGCGGFAVNTFWRRLIERHRWINAEVTQIQLEMAREGKPSQPPPLFPTRPYKSMTIAIFCVFGFFVVIATWICVQEVVVSLFR